MNRTLNIDEEILINQFVQHIHPLAFMEIWFEQRDATDKKDVLLNLLNLTIQSHPTYDEIRSAAQDLRIESTPAAVKMLNRNKPYDKFGYELINLPIKEYKNCFKLLLLSLSLADNRRKNTICRNGCQHWWHQDLSDPEVVRQLKNCNCR